MRWSLLLVAVAACASESVEPPPAPPVNWQSLNAPTLVAVKAPTAKERAIAQGYVAALAAPTPCTRQPPPGACATLPAMPALFDEMGHIVFGRKDARGRDRVAAIHDRLFGSFDDRTAAATRIWRTDDMQMVEWVLTGAHDRDWLGVPATQRPALIRGTSIVWTHDDGTITDVHIYFNVAVVKAELGVGSKELQEYVASVPPPHVPERPVEFDQPGDKDNVISVRGALDALEQGKEAAYVDSFADDVEVETLYHAKTQKKDDIRAYYRMMRKAIHQLDTTILTVRPVDKYVICEYMVSGEQVAPIGSASVPSGHDARFDIVDIIEMRDDHKIGHVWRYDGPEWP